MRAVGQMSPCTHANSSGKVVGMARTPRNDIEAKRLGKELTRLWKQAGSPSYRSIYETILRTYGHSMGSDEQVRKLHHGLVDPATTSVENLLALSRYYGVQPSEITEVVDLRERQVLVLLGSTNTPGGLGVASTSCSVRSLHDYRSVAA